MGKLEKRKALNPIWNQTLQFDVGDPSKEALFVQFYDTDDQGTQNAIGDLWVPLTDLKQGVELRQWYSLEHTSAGDVEIGLKAIDFDGPASAATPQTSSTVNNSYHSSNNSLNSYSSSSYQSSSAFSASTAHGGQSSASYGSYSSASYDASSSSHAQQSYSSSSTAPSSHSAVPPSGYPPQSAPSSAGHEGLKRSTTVGPFAKAPAHRTPQRGLIHFAPQELQRDFPHLARGSYGVVFKGWAKGIPEQIVIKDMEIQNQRTVDDWRKEIAVMSQNRSPYVAEVFGYSTQGNILTIVMEYFHNGDLYTILHKKAHLHPLSMVQRMRMARHCALGLQHLHRNHFIHRDVKSMNILVASDYTCKLADFGCAKLVSDRQVFNTVNSGTPLWMAPEVKRGQYNLPADVYSLGLVLFEIFEKKLPVFDQIRQTVVLPSSFQSASVVMPCLHPNPERRPTSEQVVQVLDQMLHNIVVSVQKLLPKDEQEKLKQENAGHNNDGMDNLDTELLHLYQHLLTKPAYEVDALIAKAFKVSDLDGHKGPSGDSHAQRAPSPKPDGAHPPPYTPHQQHHHVPSPQAHQYAPPSGHHFPGQTPHFPGAPMGVPMHQPGFHPTPGYPPGYPHTTSPGFPPGYYPGSHIPPGYPPTSPSSARSPRNDELQRHLESLSISDLQSILARHGVDSKFMFSKGDLISKIISHCGPSVLRDLQSRSMPRIYQPSTAPPSSSRSSRAAESFKLYVDAYRIGKEASILCLQDLLRDKMEGETVRTTVEALFSSYDRSSSGLIDQTSFLEMHERLLEMCR